MAGLLTRMLGGLFLLRLDGTAGNVLPLLLLAAAAAPAGPAGVLLESEVVLLAVETEALRLRVSTSDCRWCGVFALLLLPPPAAGAGGCGPPFADANGPGDAVADLPCAAGRLP